MVNLNCDVKVKKKPAPDWGAGFSDNSCTYQRAPTPMVLVIIIVVIVLNTFFIMTKSRSQYAGLLNVYRTFGDESTNFYFF
ncbi:hypothetical protein AS132_17680 [Photobacterium sanguinicancri]|uniref:Uncharacterized protein n=1 Tax=Photobacterium sanguinicancri TaxID=875932 RepID=A0ABX4FXZ7_9GAMM|nr:hypothetical protein AS132_17680 [Photobacterium sanguinicancri]OZS43763.1 hypothetical protein ASV53_11605 [Photobacterium sanguinicancri]